MLLVVGVAGGCGWLWWLLKVAVVLVMVMVVMVVEVVVAGGCSRSLKVAAVGAERHRQQTTAVGQQTSALCACRPLPCGPVLTALCHPVPCAATESKLLCNNCESMLYHLNAMEQELDHRSRTMDAKVRTLAGDLAAARALAAPDAQYLSAVHEKILQGLRLFERLDAENEVLRERAEGLRILNQVCGGWQCEGVMVRGSASGCP